MNGPGKAGRSRSVSHPKATGAKKPTTGTLKGRTTRSVSTSGANKSLAQSAVQAQKSEPLEGMTMGKRIALSELSGAFKALQGQAKAKGAIDSKDAAAIAEFADKVLVFKDEGDLSKVTEEEIRNLTNRLNQAASGTMEVSEIAGLVKDTLDLLSATEADPRQETTKNLETLLGNLDDLTMDEEKNALKYIMENAAAAILSALALVMTPLAKANSKVAEVKTQLQAEVKVHLDIAKKIKEEDLQIYFK